MRFSGITIHNFRQYRDIHFDFPRTTPCDMHIIEASNGVGKTNLMNAVNWCLYGDEPHLSGSNEFDAHTGDRLSVCNLAALEEAKSAGENTCPVYVEITGENNEGQFVFKRTVHINVHTFTQSGVDVFEARKYPVGSDMELHTGKAGELLVDQYMPKKIREYFYFDGERLLNYLTNTESTVSRIRDSIYEIAGVNFINRSGDHLKEFVKQFQKKITELSPDLDEKTKAMNAANEEVASQIEEIDKLSQQIAQAEAAIAEADRLLDGTEKSREANSQYNNNKLLIEQYKRNLEEAKANLVEFVKRYFVKLMLYKHNQSTLAYIAEREAQAAINPEVNLAAIKDSLERHECRLCTQHIPHNIEDELKKLVTRYEANVSMQTLVGIKSDIRRSLDIAGYPDEKKKLFDHIREIEEAISSLESDNDELWRIIETVGDMQGLEMAARSKKENEDLRDLNLDKRGRYRENLATLKKKATELTDAYNEAVEKDNKCGEYRAKYSFVSRALAIVESVKKGIIDDIKIQMQNETMSIFDELLWKKDTYGRVELDDNFRLQLYHKRSGQSCLYSCSAAEKELLALSFTIALHNVSGYDNLLFIDTPVGRVSDVNRENFAKVLLEVSQGKQIILAFTPSEYSDEIRSVLSKTVISSYNRLASDEDVTTIREGV